MAKHLYDKDGKYKGKILSDEEHSKKQNSDTEISLGDDEKFFIKFFLCCIPVLALAYVFEWKSYFISSSDEFQILDWAITIFFSVAVVAYLIKKKN